MRKLLLTFTALSVLSLGSPLQAQAQISQPSSAASGGGGGGGGTSSTTPVTNNATASGTIALSAPASGNTAYLLTLTGNVTLTLSGGTAGQQQRISVYLKQDSTGGRTVAFPAGIRWSAGVAPAPSLVAGDITIVHFTTVDGGTTWFGDY